jgi:hypothetical protein
MTHDTQHVSIGDIYRARLIELMDDWYEQVKEFRRLSLEATDPVERTRMRAKADTLRYRQGELKILVEEMDEIEEEKKSGNPYEWPGLNGIFNG